MYASTWQEKMENGQRRVEEEKGGETVYIPWLCLSVDEHN